MLRGSTVIFRLICAVGVFIEGMMLGHELTIRKMCYDTEKYGHGIITYTDIYGKDHSAIVEPYK